MDESSTIARVGKVILKMVTTEELILPGTHLGIELEVHKIPDPQELIVAFEEEFDIRLPDSIYLASMTAGDLVEMIDRALEVRMRIIKVIDERMADHGQSITSKTAFGNDLGFDSLDMQEILSAFEKEFGIKIETETDPEPSMTIGALHDIISSVLQKQEEYVS